MNYFRTNNMLTRREILIELRRLGVKDLSLLKRDCQNFEKYWAGIYDDDTPSGRKHPFFIRKPAVPPDRTMERI